MAKNNVSIPQAVWIACNDRIALRRRTIRLFQYRKRYGLHAINEKRIAELEKCSFNTASGMDCMQ